MNLVELSGALADLVERTGRSVVRIEGRSRPLSGTVFSEAGHLIAINHALERDELEVGLADGGTARARVVGRDPQTDLALLECERHGLAPAPWADLVAARVGHLAVGVFRPGRTVRATLGVLAALGGAWRTPWGGKIDRYVEASLPLHPGFSGGVLVDAQGKALGLSTSGLRRGVALAIPAATVRRVAEALRAGGRVRRGYLGIASLPVPLPPPLAASAGQASGLLLTQVEPDSPAGRGGLLLGDVVVGVEGRPVLQPADLLPTLDEDRVGQEIVLRVARGGELRDVRVTVGERG